ncbi:MAG: MopE-related protein [Gammaproteobacteria bacterium]|nr:MopE-related protein [Gammaproteobacteria bacterium]
MKKVIPIILGLFFSGCEDTQLIRNECPIGKVRECSWNPESTRVPVGLCKYGSQKCEVGGWSECVGAVGPTEEICDGFDNDCDLQIDETYPEQNQLCGFVEGANYGTGICAPGIMKCDNGAAYCDGHQGPEDEICDGIDNNCDGNIDEGIVNSTAIVCYDGPPNTMAIGQCRAGIRYCTEGNFDGPCDGQILPSVEICDGVDNNCDGEIDEGLSDKPVDLVFILDISGSFDDEIESMINGITPLLSDPVTTNFRFGLVVIGTWDRVNPDLMSSPFKNMRRVTDFVPADEFLDFLTAARMISSSGQEPSYDAMAFIMNGRLGFSFLEDSQKVIILMTDEEGQSRNVPSMSQSHCQTLARQNVFELYIFGPQQHWASFMTVLSNDQSRYFSPSSDAATVFQQIRDIFDDLCVGP